MIFITLNLAYGSFSTAMVKFETHRDEYISSVEGICILLSMIFLIAYFLFQNFWSMIFGLPTFIIILMVLEILACTGVDLWSGKKRFEFKYKSVIVLTLVTSILNPISSYMLVINTEEKGLAKITGSAVATIIIDGFIFVKNIINGKKLFNKEYWKYAFKFNVPLLAYYLSQVIFNQSDRIMINKITGPSDAAMYGVAYNLAIVLSFVLNAINKSYIPWYYQKIKSGEQYENRKVANGIAVLMGTLLLGVIWYAPEIVVIMAGKNYAQAVYVVPPVAMSLLLLFYSQQFVNVEFYYEKKNSLVVASISSAIVNIVLNAVLIPVFGFVVAGYTTLISYILFAISNCYEMKNILKKKGIEDVAYDYKGLVIIYILFAAIGFIGVAIYDYLILRIVITLIVFIVFLSHRKKLYDMIKTIKNLKTKEET
jgi:O-antigen/teichoic acid export membrane protein